MPPSAAAPLAWPPPGLDLLASDEGLMRQALAAFAASAAAGTLALRLPQRLGAALPRGEGHFHLTPELFLQVSGWTRFRFPQGALLLRAGQALVVPPQLRHAERVGADGPAAGRAFCNLVIRAEDGQFTCHLAREQRGPGAAAGLPAIVHLQARTSALAPRLHDWLCDATAAGAGAAAGTGAGTGAGGREATGDAAPDFTLPDQDGNPVTLSDVLAQGPAVLFFYPAALTPGCTKEACHFRDIVGEFTAAPVYPGTDAAGSPRRAGLELAIEIENKPGDDAAYWQPTLFDGDTAVEPQSTARNKVADFCARQFSSAVWLSPYPSSIRRCSRSHPRLNRIGNWFSSTLSVQARIRNRS